MVQRAVFIIIIIFLSTFRIQHYYLKPSHLLNFSVHVTLPPLSAAPVGNTLTLLS